MSILAFSFVKFTDCIIFSLLPADLFRTDSFLFLWVVHDKRSLSLIPLVVVLVKCCQRRERTCTMQFCWGLMFVSLQGCVKVWDIRDQSPKTPVSQLDCLVRTFNICVALITLVHGRPHMGANGVSWPPGKMDEKLKSEIMQKSFLCLCYILRAVRAGRCRERRYADHIFIQIYFRMHHFENWKFSSPQVARGHWPPNQNPVDVPALVLLMWW